MILAVSVFPAPLSPLMMMASIGKALKLLACLHKSMEAPRRTYIHDDRVEHPRQGPREHRKFSSASLSFEKDLFTSSIQTQKCSPQLLLRPHRLLSPLEPLQGQLRYTVGVWPTKLHGLPLKLRGATFLPSAPFKVPLHVPWVRGQKVVSGCASEPLSGSWLKLIPG